MTESIQSADVFCASSKEYFTRRQRYRALRLHSKENGEDQFACFETGR